MKRIVLAHVSLHGMNSIPSLLLSTPYIICSGVAYIWTQCRIVASLEEYKIKMVRHAI